MFACRDIYFYTLHCYAHVATRSDPPVTWQEAYVSHLDALKAIEYMIVKHTICCIYIYIYMYMHFRTSLQEHSIDDSDSLQTLTSSIIK